MWAEHAQREGRCHEAGGAYARVVDLQVHLDEVARRTAQSQSRADARNEAIDAMLHAKYDGVERANDLTAQGDFASASDVFNRIGVLDASIAALSGRDASRVDATRAESERAHDLGSAVWSSRLNELNTARDLAQMERELEALAGHYY